jgi:hypothetical protein
MSAYTVFLTNTQGDLLFAHLSVPAPTPEQAYQTTVQLYFPNHQAQTISTRHYAGHGVSAYTFALDGETHYNASVEEELEGEAV